MVGAPWASFWNRVRSRSRGARYSTSSIMGWWRRRGETEPGLRPTVLALSHLSAGAGEEPSIRILCSSQRQHNFALDSPLEGDGFEISVPGRERVGRLAE